MLHSIEDKVRLRAYEIWVSAGMADGMADHHWVSAEQAILNEHAKPKKVRAKASPTSKAAGETKGSARKTKKAAAAQPSKAKAPRVTN